MFKMVAGLKFFLCVCLAVVAVHSFVQAVKVSVAAEEAGAPKRRAAVDAVTYVLKTAAALYGSLLIFEAI